jgi:hypothetical protein
MTVSTVFAAASGTTITHGSGRKYVAVLGLVSVPGSDAEVVGGVGAVLTPLFKTGTTSDRLSLNPSPGNNFQRPPPQLAFLDTTLSAICWYVGALSATQWVNQSGSAV